MMQEHARIVKDEDVMGGEPRIKGHRISVRQIAERVEGRGLKPQTVADRYDLDVADVYHALAYYHDHPEEMAKIEREREELEKEALEKYSDSNSIESKN
ncbi:MAG: DUF433 domain-containing protein [Halobacteria archaeon]|nr:DUF433 domain-containing protein [Halobacteria archaeon]